MIPTKVRAPAENRRAEATQRFVEAVLDELEVTERAYHHMNYTLPLIADLVHRTRLVADPGDRVLIIGGSTLLAEALMRLGYDVDLWQFAQAHLTDDVKPLVSRSITPETLPDAEPPAEKQQVIILPLVIEALAGSPEPLLRKLRRALAPGGRLIIATENQSRLAARMAALTGRPILPKAKAEAVSLSWPALAPVRQYHPDELKGICRNAGFHARRVDFVVPERAFLEMEPLNVQDYAMRKLRFGVARVLPRVRDVAVLELAPRVGDRAPLKTRSDNPTVTVFVSAQSGGDHLAETLSCLGRQTYPPELYEVVLLHDNTRDDVRAILVQAALESPCQMRELVMPAADGPDSRNRAMAEAKSDISAHTTDSCYLPDDWIQGAVKWFDADTAVIAGPVLPKAGSDGRWLEVPGSRPDPDDKGVSPHTLFSISNVFYRTSIALAAGGFDREFTAKGGHNVLGWDTELAWRLQRSGWNARFREDVYEFRFFPPDKSRLSWVLTQMRRASELPRLVAEVPEYGEKSLMAGVFASRQTLYFDMAVAGLGAALTRREWPWLALAFPWLGTVSQRVDVWPPQGWPGSARTVARITARQAVWLAGFVLGSMKSRRIVL